MDTKPKVSVGMVNPPHFQSMEEMEARKRFNKFKASSQEEYETKIKHMTSSDLHDHSLQVGIRPNPERNQSIANLISLYKKAFNLVRACAEHSKGIKPMPLPYYLQ